MFRLPVFFAFAALLAVPVQCGKTLVTVPISLICKGPFTYTIYLLTDTTFNDLIATLGGEASDEFEGVLSGYDNGDWGKSYEFVVRIKHTCNEEKERTVDRTLTSIPCLVTNTHCNFPTEVFEL